MNRIVRFIFVLSACVPLCAALAGCSKSSAVNTDPNKSPSDNRAAMVQWHKDHDKH